MEQNFMEWLYTHLDADDWVGDLARDSKVAHVPASGGALDLYNAMQEHGACMEAYVAFNIAVNRYRAHVGREPLSHEQ